MSDVTSGLWEWCCIWWWRALLLSTDKMTNKSYNPSRIWIILSTVSLMWWSSLMQKPQQIAARLYKHDASARKGSYKLLANKSSSLDAIISWVASKTFKITVCLIDRLRQIFKGTFFPIQLKKITATYLASHLSEHEISRIHSLF